MKIQKKDKISFVIPAYNCADTIEESVDSIIKGNFEEGDELIIINDGSTDKTAQIIRNLENKYPFITTITNRENIGCPATRNIGINRASNPLIFNLDSDNILEPNSVSKLKDFLISNEADLAAFSEYHYFRKNTKKITRKWIYKPKEMTLADFLSGIINPGPGGNFLYTKNSWKKIGGYWEYGAGLHEAWGYTLKQLANNSKFVILPKSFYYHRYGHESLFIRETKKEDANSKIATKMLSHYFNLIEEEDVEYIKNNKNTWFSDLNNRPIKVKGASHGRNGKTIYKINYKNKIRKLIIRIIKYFRLYNIIKNKILVKKFQKEFKKFQIISKNKNRFSLKWKNKKPYLNDNTSQTNFDAHYIYHPAWAIRILKNINPEKHIDISSTLHFCSMLSAFIYTEFYDFRPAQLNLNNLESKKADLTHLPFENNSIKSLSCMHTVEHIGLGRYGDKLDPDGDLKAIEELKRVLAIGGNLLFVVPIGKPKIVFNAHRIYSYNQIISYFRNINLKSFSLVTDTNNFIPNASKTVADKQNFGCGCFWFKKSNNYKT